MSAGGWLNSILTLSSPKPRYIPAFVVVVDFSGINKKEKRKKMLPWGNIFSSKIRK